METIRPSSLSSFNDCPKRALADIFPNLVTKAGYELKEVPHGIAAIVGTAAHAGIAALCHGKPMAFALARAKNVLLDEVEKVGGVHENMFDRTTVSLAVARAQVGSMLASYVPLVAAANASTSESAGAIEKRISGVIHGVAITGSPDRVADTKLIDIKTGQQRPHQVQLGAYALLLEANGVTVTEAVIHHVKRSPNVKQPPVWVEAVDIDIAKKAAAVTIQRFEATRADFAATGDKWGIPENPNSSLCKAKYCKAYGTDFCSTWRPYVYVADRAVVTA